MSAQEKQQNYAHLPHFDAVCFEQPPILTPPFLLLLPLHLPLLLLLSLLPLLFPFLPLLTFYCCCCLALTPPCLVVALLLQLPAFYLSRLPHATCLMPHAAVNCNSLCNDMSEHRSLKDLPILLPVLKDNQRDPAKSQRKISAEQLQDELRKTQRENVAEFPELQPENIGYNLHYLTISSSRDIFATILQIIQFIIVLRLFLQK